MNSDRLTPEEAAKELGKSVDVIYSMCASGELSHFRIRRSIQIPRAALDEFLKASYHPARRDFFGRNRRNQGPTKAEVEAMLADTKPFGA